MSKRFIDRVLGFLGYEEDEFEAEQLRVNEEQVNPTLPTKKGGAVFSLHAPKSVKVVIVEPGTFEEAQGIAEHLKNRRQVIINLEHAEKELAKRVIDFVSGATYALDGTVQKIANGVFLFAPANVDVSSDLRDDIKERNILWASIMRGDKK
ncbi:MAG: cell division protein SepF [Firmicutes bacterium]|nr:cell division protein SepF [Bacillota bacterium]